MRPCVFHNLKRSSICQRTRAITSTSGTVNIVAGTLVTYTVHSVMVQLPDAFGDDDGESCCARIPDGGRPLPVTHALLPDGMVNDARCPCGWTYRRRRHARCPATTRSFAPFPPARTASWWVPDDLTRRRPRH